MTPTRSGSARNGVAPRASAVVAPGGWAFRSARRTGGHEPRIWAIYQDRKKALWLGTQTGLVRHDNQGWRVFTTQDGLSSDSIRAIAEDQEGNLG